ncbi:MAG: type VI secretion system baseplate subunit TssF [Gemmataceae bacterium]
MTEPIYRYYERELLFIRQMAQEFARLYPGAAGRLLLEPNRSVDPHVERLIEAFALLTGRVQHKLDDEFPELTDALFSILYPHYLKPIPSCAVVQFQPDPARTPMKNGFVLPRGSKLRTRPVNDLPCKYRSIYPVTLWPLNLVQARMQSPPFPPGFRPPPGTAAALRLVFDVQSGNKLGDLTLDTLRFYLFGENQFVATLYEVLFNHTLQVVLLSPTEPGRAPVVLDPAEVIQPVGFEDGEGLLPYPSQSFKGYRLLTEFFAFPAKFYFFDLTKLSRLCKGSAGKTLEVQFYLSRTSQALEQGIDASTFRMGCTPVVNLFEQVAEPVALSQTRYEYRVIPDVAQPLGMEVYSIDEVSSTDPTAGVTTTYQPFYSFRHGEGTHNRRAFWYATRRPTTREGDNGTEVYLNLVDLDFDPRLPAASTLLVRTTCFNRDLARQLQRAGDQLYFELEAVAPLAGIRCIRTPTLPLRAHRRRNAYWRLLSHLSLNHLSISDPVEGRAALQEILRLYDFSDPELGQQLAEVNRLLIDGITSVSSRRVLGRTGSGTASGFCRGVEVTLELDEEKYIGTGVYLFASVLERFLGLYASLNSFTQLVVRTRQTEGILKKWPPRAGEQSLI